ncbi:hypothetical protein MRB53_025811 [Persea americana]|uniref:Uncharacterized protein n=1 Tax=Persea americana TaxID=3435 RepID=A0ACC2LG96_PERAE|nr:hypothetical protein MRB53_025811 [Persea americana]
MKSTLLLLVLVLVLELRTVSDIMLSSRDSRRKAGKVETYSELGTWAEGPLQTNYLHPCCYSLDTFLKFIQET